jgi:M3 family oligoendopeptidase
MRTKVRDLPYSRFDMKRLEDALNTFIEAEKNAKSVDDVILARKEWLDVVDEFGTNYSLASSRYTLDTRDEFYLAEQEYYDEVSPICSDYMTKYAKVMWESRFRPELEKILPETVYPSYECQMKSFSPEIIPDQQEENALTTKYTQLLSQLTTEWRGEQKTIAYIRGFLEDADRQVRKQAAEAIDRALASISDDLDNIYDQLVKVRTRMARKLGYDNYIELGYYRMGRIDYDKDMVAKFRENVLKSIVPVVTEMKKGIAKSLGIDDMKFYDNDVIEGDGNPRPYPDEQGILKSAQEMYKEMHPAIGEFMDSMLEAEAFDVTARDGKCGGGYCTSFDKYKQEFIFANFNGSAGDVDVLTHEFGHAIAMHYTYENEDPDVGIGSMETAETHSMSMEFFAWKFMDKFFKDAERYKYSHLASCLTFIPYGIIVDEFQHIVYGNPDMTPQERNQAYLELEKKYRPYMNYEGLDYLSKGTRWQFQSHIYEAPFYYIDYCLAQVIALEFLDELTKDYNLALDKYIGHCKRGGQYPFNKLVKLAGLKSPFEDGALDEIAQVSSNIIATIKK